MLYLFALFCRMFIFAACFNTREINILNNKDMKTKLFLLSVCLGSAAAQPAKMFTAQPFSVISELLAAGNTLHHVTISAAKL